jgi:hypothetical protein
MPDTAPLVNERQANTAAVAAAADLETKVGEAPFAATVSRVGYVPATTITGANTDSRTLQLFNRGQDGLGTVKVAELAMVSGVNAPADDEKAITVITARDRVVIDGVTYEVDGQPRNVWTPRGSHHVRVNLTAVAG